MTGPDYHDARIDRWHLADGAVVADRQMGTVNLYLREQDQREITDPAQLASALLDAQGVVAPDAEEAPDEKIALAFSPGQLSMVLSAMLDKDLELERYLSSFAHAGKTASPEQDCCDYHRMRYERDVEMRAALSTNRRQVKKTIKRIEKALALSAEKKNGQRIDALMDRVAAEGAGENA